MFVLKLRVENGTKANANEDVVLISTVFSYYEQLFYHRAPTTDLLRPITRLLELISRLGNIESYYQLISRLNFFPARNYCSSCPSTYSLQYVTRMWRCGYTSTCNHIFSLSTFYIPFVRYETLPLCFLDKHTRLPGQAHASQDLLRDEPKHYFICTTGSVYSQVKSNFQCGNETPDLFLG